MDGTLNQALDRAVQAAIKNDELPGAVLMVGHSGRVIHHCAYGHRALLPSPEAMTRDTIFDCASLTKVVATSAALMRVFEAGQFQLEEPITEVIPEFMQGQSSITVCDLLTHFSGLEPDVPIEPEWSGYETGIRLACTFPPAQPPGQSHIYSDINFILLGELVRRRTGLSLPAFAKGEVFEPLAMVETAFLPPEAWIPRIAPTEILPGAELPLRGVVHDPTTRMMGGIAGHAGLFSTADDLGRFAQMMLNRGELDGTRIAKPETVEFFTQSHTPAGQPILRGLGWDIDSPYSSNRGRLFPVGGFGHTGFTGTSLWIDAGSQSYVILLSNSVHPHGRPALKRLRSEVATLVAEVVLASG